MISLTYTNINGGIIMERELTEAELSTVTHRHVNNTHIIFYQGDEPEELLPSENVVATPQYGAALSALMNATPEELEQIKQILS